MKKTNATRMTNLANRKVMCWFFELDGGLSLLNKLGEDFDYIILNLVGRNM